MKFNFIHNFFSFIKSQNFFVYKRLFMCGMIGFSLSCRDKLNNKKNILLLLKTQEPESNSKQIESDSKDKNMDKIESDLDFHIRSFQHYLEKSLSHEKIKFTLIKDNVSESLRIKNSLSFYHFDKTIKKLSREIRKINKILRNYLNVLDDNFSIQVMHSEFDINQIVSEIRQLQEIKSNSFFSEDEKTKHNHSILENYLFLYQDLLILRLFSAFMIIHKNNLYEKREKNILTEENIEYILNHSKHKLIKELKNEDVNESVVYFVKRIFINYFAKSKDYFYSDFILELNKGKNFKQFFESDSEKIDLKDIESMKVDDDSTYDLDIIFVSGLNSEFSKTWRVPKSKEASSLVDYLRFLLYGKNIEKVYSVPSYELWIPKMFEDKTFKNKNIRYLVTNVETKIFPGQLKHYNIPDYTIDEIADKICSALSSAGVGKRPFLIVSHSMGGLISKKVLSKSEDNNKLINNKYLRGVVFFSTPHFGSNIIYNVLDIAISKYFKFFQIFHTTSSEYGLHEEDIKSTVTDFKYTKATKEICFQSKEDFEKEHRNFRNMGVKYICINETHKTYIEAIGENVHIVDPESCYLPETKNYFLKNKIHSDVQKFSPENFDDEGYRILTLFIEDSFLKDSDEFLFDKNRH
jgi:hypothetical protein